jgi:hypothetical protein
MSSPVIFGAYKIRGKLYVLLEYNFDGVGFKYKLLPWQDFKSYLKYQMVTTADGFRILGEVDKSVKREPLVRTSLPKLYSKLHIEYKKPGDRHATVLLKRNLTKPKEALMQRQIPGRYR